MSTTVTTWDRTQLADSIFWKGQYWPVIRGGADTDSDDSGDGTSTETDDATSGEQDDQTDQKDEKVFTQEQLNAIVAREASKAQRGKLDPKELGFDSAKELKAFLDESKAALDAAKDEETKALEEAIAEARKLAQDEVLSKANQRILKSEFMLAAMEQGLHKDAREDAFLLAQTLEGWTGVEVDDDGRVSGFDDAFFEELKEKKSYLFSSESADSADTEGGDIGVGRRGSGGATDKERSIRSLFPALGG